jgi:protein SMG6
MLEYGRASSVVSRARGFGGTKEGMHTNSSGVKVMVKRATTIAEDEETKWTLTIART